MEWLDDLVALAALAFCALAPGLGLLAVMGRDRRIPAELQLPLAVLATTLLAAPVSVLQMTYGIDGARITNWWVALSAIGLVAYALSLRPARVERAGIGRVIAWGAGVIAVLSFVVGGLIDGDAMYHAAYAERLAHLADPGFASTQVFVDGSPHEGYLVPSWHFLVAQASLLAGAPVLEVMRAGASLSVALMWLAFAGLGRAVFGKTAGAAWTGLGFLLVNVVRPTSAPLWAISVGMWPGSISLWIALPVALALLLLAADARAAGWRLLVAAAGAASAMVILHVTYALWLGIVLAALLLVLAIEAAARRSLAGMRPAIAAAGSVFAGIVVTTVAYLQLSSRVVLPLDAPPTGVRAKDLEFFEPLLAGEGSLRVAAHVYAAAGTPALVGLLGAAAAVLVLRTRAAATIAAWVLAIILVSQVEVLTTAVARAAGLSHIIRLPQALPLELGVAVACALVMLALERCHRSGRFSLPATCALVIAGGALVAASAAWPAIEGRFSKPEVPEAAALALLGAAALLAAVSLFTWWRSRRSAADAGAEQVVLPQPNARFAAAGALLLALVLAPAWLPSLAPVPDRLRELDEPASARDLAANVSPWAQSQIRALPQRSVVLVGPVTFAPVVTATAPVYVAAYPKVHTADTLRNRRTVRIALVRRFTFLDIETAEREAILKRLRVDSLLVPSRSAAADAVRAAPARYVDVQTRGDWLFARVVR